MVDRLYWRAGFGATQAQRDYWVGRGHLNLVDWLLDTPPSLAPTSTPPLTSANQPIDPLVTEDELVMEWLDRMQRAVNPLRERLAFFWHRHWAVTATTASRPRGWSPTATACSPLPTRRAASASSRGR